LKIILAKLDRKAGANAVGRHDRVFEKIARERGMDVKETETAEAHGE